jgi:F-type H+-transporting ATPase subunit delta
MSDLVRLSQLISGDRRAIYFLLHPLVPYARKESLLEAVCETAVARRLVRVLIETNNMGLVSEIARQLARVAEKELGIVRATARTAAEITPADRERLRAALSEALGKPVDLRVSVDPRLLGGISLRVGDRVLDNTIMTQLKTAKVRLGST